jgi:signal transduction histidine kinase/ligand-binding sensor domain-containing protein
MKRQSVISSITAALISSACIFCAFSQPVHFSFSYITPDMGLSSSAITCILQDHKGFIWIGTFDGLNRYDGNKFTIYKSNSFDSASLPHNNVWCILEDHRNNLLFGTSGGLGLYDWSTDKFVNYMTSASSPLRGLALTVRQIDEDKAGDLWLATDNGLIYFNRKENTARQFRNDPGNPLSISNSNIEHVLIDSRGNVWAATWNGIDLYIPETSSFRRYIYNPELGSSLLNTSFYHIVEDQTGNLWFGTYGHGLYRLNIDNIESGEFVHYQHDPDNIKSLSGNRILSLYIDDLNNLWIGTENEGLNLYDRKNECFWHYHPDVYSLHSLNNESINAIYKDKSGNFWIGTFAGGINFSKKNSDAVFNYRQIPGFKYSLSHNSVTSFLEDHDGQIWVGTDGGGLNNFDIKKGYFTTFSAENSTLNSNAVLSVIEDSDNEIWLGTWAGGLNMFDKKDKSFRAYTTTNSEIPDDNIFTVTEGKKGHIWMGSFQSGLILFDKKSGRFKNYTVENSNICSNMTTDVKRISDKSLIIGTNYGLNIYNYEDDRIIPYTYEQDNKNSLSNNTISEVLVENDSIAWIGTLFGLNRFNINTGVFTHYYEENGLPDNSIKSMAFDLSGQLWVSTNKGVVRFNPQGGRMKHLTKEDGLQGNEFNRNSALRIRSGAILFGGVKGFNIIHPDKIIENTNIPDIVITDFRIFNKPVEQGVEGSPLNKDISEIKELTLSYKQSVITFDFTAMDFTVPEKNQYAYMMEGFEKEWNYIGTNHTATYTNLNPGEYVFRVKGSNNDGVWNEEGTSIKITITPPWWKTLAFKLSLTISLSLIIIIAALGFYLSRIKSLKAQQLYLEKLVSERTREIEEKNNILTEQAHELNETNTLLEERQQKIEEQTKKLKIQKEELEDANIHLTELNSTKDKFFSIIAHDLKNPFNSILGFSELMNQKYDELSEEKKRRYSEVIYSSSRNIYALLENLLQWARTQTNKIAFEPVSFNINQLVEQNIILLSESLTDKKINVRKELKESYDVYADPNMINTVIRNLLSNAIKYTNPGGEILIGCIRKDSKIEVSIRDTGTGMTPEVLDKLFRVDANFSSEGTQGETGTGLGLILCNEFVTKNGGTISVESSPGKGSKFTFTLPANG